MFQISKRESPTYFFKIINLDQIQVLPPTRADLHTMRTCRFCTVIQGLLSPCIYALGFKTLLFYSGSVQQNRCRRFHVHRYFPERGTELGDTRVTVVGGGFSKDSFLYNYHSIYCIFDDIKIHATVLSDRKLYCHSPPHRPGAVSFKLISGNSTSDAYVTDRLLGKYEYTIMATLFSVTPNAGTVGFPVQVLGGGFQNSTTLTCFFGSIASQAVFISHIEITCTVPLSISSTVTDVTYLTVSNNGVDLEGRWAEIQFLFINHTQVYSVDPTTAPSTGGTNLFVRGVGFAQTRGVLSNTAYCKIGNQVVVASILADDELVCSVPSISNITSASFFTLTVSIDDGHRYTDYLSAPIILIHPPSEIVSAIAVNDEQSNASLVRVYGSHFYRSTYIACLLGRSVVAAVWKSSSLLFCAVPKSAVVFEANLQICTNGQTSGMSKNSVLVQLSGFLALSDIDPGVGPELGGITVSMIGRGFKSEGFYCRFGGITVRATTVFNHTAATCLLPPAPKGICGSVSIEISTTHGLYYTHSGKKFTYICTQFIESVKPTIGPVRGGTALVIRGIFRTQANDIECRFETSRGQMLFTQLIQKTEEMIICVTPSYPHQLVESLAFVTIDLVISKYRNWSISSSFVSFYYYRELEFQSVYPSRGSELGGTKVILRGRFPQTQSALCMFGYSSTVPATISADSISCRTPPAFSTFLRDPVVPITVSLNNGQDVELTHLSFRYLKASYITRIEPVFGSVCGGMSIRLHGSGFPFDLNFSALCMFGSFMQTEGRILSDDQIECDIPISTSTGLFHPTVSFNFGVDSIPSSANFTFTACPKIKSIAPIIISKIGGVGVVISGENFDCLRNTRALHVTIDHLLVEATYVSDDSITFVSPKMNIIGNMSVRLLSDERNFVEGSLTLSIVPQPSLISIAPSFGFDKGGTNLILLGIDFTISIDFLCLFKSATREFISLAKILSKGKALCLQPTMSSGIYQLAIESLGVYSNSLPFNVYDSLTLHSIHPILGSTSGGTKVTVRGSNFHELYPISCRFGRLDPVPAHFVNENSIICVSPRGSAGIVKFAVVSGDGAVLSDQGGLNFTFYQQPYILYMIPNCVPLSSSVSRLSVIGKHFDVPDGIKIDIGGIRSTMHVLNETFGYITLPRLPFSPTLNDYSEMNMTVALSMNEVDFYPGPRFVLYEDITVRDVYPKAGFDHGGEIITVQGLGFFRSPDAKCRFGAQVVSAVIRSASILECRSPRALFIGPVSFAVSQNSYDWTSGDIIFNYIVKPVIKKVSPTTIPVMTKTVVSVFWNFVYDPSWTITCLFGNVSVSTTFANQELIVCSSPEVELPGPQPFDVMVNGVALVENQAIRPIITFVDPLLYSVWPSFGVLDVVTTVSITRMSSRDPVHDTDISCSLCVCRYTFDDSFVASTMINQRNASILTCETPDISAYANGDVLHSLLDIGLDSLNGFISMTQVSRSFIFKRSPIEIILKPDFGSSYGNTDVHIYPAESSHGFWFNSEVISCRFGPRITIATWIGFRELVCRSPPLNAGSTEIVVSVTDDGVNFSGGAIFTYSDLPVVFSFKPSTTYTGSFPLIVVFGFGFKPMRSQASCIFRNHLFSRTITTTATIHNSTVLTCFVTAALVESSGYWNLSVSNNGQDYSESIDTIFSVIQPPIVSAFFPKFGIIGKDVDISIKGFNLIGVPIFCILERTAEISQSPRSLVHVFNSSYGSCRIHCSAEESNMPLRLYFVSLDFTVNSTQFWCEPVLQIESIVPMVIPVGWIVPLQIVGAGFRPWNNYSCVFESSSFIYVEACAFIDNAVQCDSPRFLFPQILRVSVFLSDQLWVISSNVEISVVPELRIEATIPSTIFSGQSFLVKGENFDSYKVIGLNCVVRGQLLSTRFHNDSYVECITNHENPVALTGTITITVGGNLSFSYPGVRIDILVYPSVDSFGPLLGLCQGRTTISAHGRNLHGLSSPMCVFDGISTTAWTESDSVLKCDTPMSSWKGAVQFRVIAANLLSPIIDDTFTYIEPWSITFITPRSGPLQGGTPLSIHGKNFIETKHVFCVFGESKSPAIVISDVLLACESTPTISPGLVSFSLSIGGQWSNIITRFGGSNGSHDTGGFLYFLNPFINNAKLSDTKLDLRHVKLKLELSEIIDDNGLMYMNPECVFARSKTKARIVGGSKLVCNVTEVGPDDSVIYFTATLNGIDFMNNLTVVYTHSWTVESISPDRGPVSGGTEVSLLGFSIKDLRRSLQCRFGDHRPIQAKFDITTGTYVCLTSSVSEEGYVSLFLSINGREWHDSGVNFHYENWSVELFTSRYIVGTYEDNGKDLLLSVIIRPAIGPSFGGTEISVLGSHFSEHGSTLCWFGDIATIGHVKSSSLVSCELPPLSMNQRLAFYTTSFTLRHSFLDGRQLKMLEPLQFIYLNTPVISSSINVFPRTILSSMPTLVRMSSDIISRMIRSHSLLIEPMQLYIRYGPIVIPVIYEHDVIEFITSPFDGTDDILKFSSNADSFNLNVGLSFDGGLSYIQCDRLTVVKSPQLYGIEPETFIPGFHSSISIRGSSLTMLGPATCNIGVYSISATVVTSSLIECQLESNTAFAIDEVFLSVSVTWKEFNFTSTTLRLVLHRKPCIKSITPSYVLQDGGDTVVITGNYFKKIGSQGKVIVKGNNLFSYEKAISLRVTDDNTAIFITPLLAAGQYSICIDYDGFCEDFNCILTFQPRFAIVAISPDYGSPYGGTVSSVVGGYFNVSLDYECFLGMEDENKTFTTSANVLNISLLECVLPSSLQVSGTVKELQANLSIIRKNDGFQSNTIAYYFAYSHYIFSINPRLISLSDVITLNVKGLKMFKNYNCRLSFSNGNVRFYSAVSIGFDELQCGPFVDIVDGKVRVSVVSDGYFSEGNSLEIFTRSLVNEYRDDTESESLNPSASSFEDMTRNISLVVTDLFPYRIPARSNAKILITGRYFDTMKLIVDEDPVTCVVGGKRFPISVISPEQLFCELSELEIGTFKVSLSIPGSSLIELHSMLVVYPPAVVYYYGPSEGPSEGGTEILINGRGFLEFRNETICSFASGFSISARVFNDSMLSCISPSFLGHVNFTVTSSFRLTSAYDALIGPITNFELPFIYYAAEVVSSVKPKIGPIEGNTSILVDGYGFIDTVTLSCKFGSLVRRAIYISYNSVICSTPPIFSFATLVDKIFVTVSNNGKDFSRSSSSFSYYHTPSIHSIHPHSGPPGTAIIIRFDQQIFFKENSSCLFNRILVPDSAAVRSNMMSCRIPQISTHSLNFTSDVVTFTLEISFNGIDYRDTGFVFHYTHEPLIYDIDPTFGPKTGGNLIWVDGAYFERESMCDFGGISVNASFHSDSLLSCLAPAMDTGIVTFNVISRSTLGRPGSSSTTIRTYAFLETISILRLNTYHGTILGGTALSIHCQDLPHNVPLVCVFGPEGDFTVASMQSIDIIGCVTPARKNAGLIGVRIGFTSQHGTVVLSSNEISFTYTEPIHISGVMPSRGPSIGLNHVIVELTGMIVPSIRYTVLCRFCNVTFIGEFLSANSITCLLPYLKYAETNPFHVQTILFSWEDRTLMDPWHRVIFSIRYGDEITDLLVANMTADRIQDSLRTLTDSVTLRASRHEISRSRMMYQISFTSLKIKAESQEPMDIIMHKEVDENLSTRVYLDSYPTCSVSISLNGVDFFVGIGDEYIIDDHPHIIDLRPAHGSLRGGTPVVVKGSGFSPPQEFQDILCHFGGIKVKGSFISTTEIRCATPSFPTISKVHVGIIGLNFNDTSFSELVYEYVDDVVLYNSFPSTLPLQPEYLGEYISIYGRNVLSSQQLTCRFAIHIPGTDIANNFSLSTKAIYLNSTSMLCENAFSWKMLSILPSTLDFTEWSKYLLTQTDIALLIQVTTNGEDWSNTVKVSFAALAQIDSVHPNIGRATGGTVIHIIGRNFIESEALACHFGRMTVVHATFISPMLVKCTSPPLGEIGQNYTQSLTITNNGVHPSNVVPFQYYGDLVLLDFHPSFGWMSGGEILTITFYSYPFPLGEVKQIYCRFNSTLSPVTEVNMTEGLLRCRSPPSSIPGYATFGTTLNQVDYFTSQDSFLYLMEEVRSISMIPNHGPYRGGTSLKVKGLKLFTDITLLELHVAAKCRFGVVLVEARIERADTILCRSPPKPIGADSIEVGLSLSGGLDDFIDIGHFKYDYDLTILELKPNNGPRYGGTIVKVYGGPFIKYNEHELACRFGDAIVQGTLVDENLIECVSPGFTMFETLQTISFFNALWVPEIQTILIEKEEVAEEILSIETVGAFRVRNEVQLLTHEARELCNISGWYRLKILDEWSDPLEPYLPATSLEVALQKITELNAVHVQKSQDSYIIEFNSYIGSPPHGYVPKSAGNLPLIIVDASNLRGNCTFAAVEIQNGTDPLSNDYEDRGFRLINPGVSSNYRLSRQTRWLRYNESDVTMKEALLDAGGLPSDITVRREGPFLNGGYRWDIFLPKGFTFHGATFGVVRYGGGGIKLRGTDAGVETFVKRLAVVPSPGYFTLSLDRSNHFRRETTRPIQWNTTMEALRFSLEELGSISEVHVSSHALNGDKGIVGWDVTFSSMRDSGDLPLLSLERVWSEREITQRTPSIHISELRKGLSNVVHRIQLSTFHHFRLVCADRVGHYLQIDNTDLDVENELKIISDTPNVAVHIHREPNTTELFILQISETLCPEVFGAYLFNRCDGVVDSLCFSKYAPAEIWCNKTTNDIHGYFSLVYDSTTSRHTPDIEFGSPLTAVHEALSSIFTNFSVEASYQLKNSSSGLHSESMLHIHLRDSYHTTIDGAVKPILRVNESLLHGTPYEVSYEPIRTYVRSVTRDSLSKGLTVPVDVTINGLDFSVGNSFFYYRPALEIFHLSPSNGPLNGGTDITVFGFGFYETQILLCRLSSSPSGYRGTYDCNDGNLCSNARYVNNTVLKCYSPPSLYPGTFYLSLINPIDSVYYEVTSELPYIYDRPFIISEISPMHGSSEGLSSVHIMGGPFCRTNQCLLKCRFGDTVVQAHFVDEHHITCFLPAHSPGRVPVAVTQNGEDYIESTLPFTYHELPHFTFTRPSSGPAFGHSDVHVHGFGFYKAENALCQIGSRATKLIYLSEVELVCEVPALFPNQTLKWLPLSYPNEMNRFTPASHLTAPLPYPSYKSLNVSITVSLNGQEYYSTGLKFIYQRDIHIADVSRVTGPIVGGTPVFVLGSGFVNSTFLTCRFDEISSRGIFLTRNVILCISPEFVYNFALKESAVKLKISNNAVAFSSAPVKFIYFAETRPGSYHPGVEKETELICPRGAYCKLKFTTNFTVCPLGTFQPNYGQDSCHRCPIGSICPVYGSPTYRTCPEGYICDVSGLSHADIPCPAGFSCGAGTGQRATKCVSRETAPTEMCWDNSTDDFGLQSSNIPGRFWDESRLLPLDSITPSVNRGRFCAEEIYGINGYRCHANDRNVTAQPLPCPVGFYCPPGTSTSISFSSQLISPRPCLGAAFCPALSSNPLGVGYCPRGFFCRFGHRTTCPVGTECPYEGLWDPIPCPPGTFNYMVGQVHCALCPIGHFCNGYGRLDPAICPHGMVCSKRGLIGPNLRCPAGFYCTNGTQTSDPFRNDTSLRPYPCSPGTYCASGTGFNSVSEGDFLYAQPCSAGFYCEAASISATGSGPCPPGFICPKGTGTPIPSPKGFYAKWPGTIQASACLPGYFAPLIESKECYPCPAGTSCDGEGLISPDICPPGTYRDSAEFIGVSCTPCPQGTWSQQWQADNLDKCLPCPSGLVCNVEGTMSLCNLDDLPTPYEPIVLIDGVPSPTYVLSSINRPLPLSIDECLQLNFGKPDEEFFFGELIPPYIDILGRGPNLRRTDQSSLKYQSSAKCYRNSKPKGSLTYQLISAFYGSVPYNQISIFDDQKGVSLCSHGFHLFNSSTSKTGGMIIFTDPDHDFEGGYDVVRCPSYDKELGCFVGPIFPGRCCNINPWSERAIYRTSDQFYQGTCLSDQICSNDFPVSARMCPDGTTCGRGSTDTSTLECTEGYVCPFGSTRDSSLNLYRAQFLFLCPEGYFCGKGTAWSSAKDNHCPPSYFCPTGTVSASDGLLANDGLRRDLKSTVINPLKNQVNLRYLGNDRFMIFSDHDMSCLNGIDGNLDRRLNYSQVTSVDSRNDLPIKYNNMRTVNAEKCARDHKWRHVYEAVRRGQCDCNAQFLIILALYRIWKCKEPNEDSSHSSINYTDRFYGEHIIGGSWGCSEFLQNIINGSPLNLYDVFTIENKGSPDRPDLKYRVKMSPSVEKTMDSWEEVRSAFHQLDHSTERMKAVAYSIRRAIDLIDTYGDGIAQLVYFEVTEEDTDPVLIANSSDVRRFLGLNQSYLNKSFSAGRLDVCECDSLLKCPDGTTTLANTTTSLFSCVSEGFVIRRVSAVSRNPSAIPSADPESSHLLLKATNKATLRFNFNGIPNNMTYGLDYRVSIYVNCKPCPTHYKCHRNMNNQQCAEPTVMDQRRNLNNCLRYSRIPVCVDAMANYVDISICKKNGTKLGISHLLYTVPDLSRCMSSPFFCSDQNVTIGRFRRLCQDKLTQGSLGFIYDCSLKSLWDKYVVWKNQICCSRSLFSNGSGACVEGVCNPQDPLIEKIIREKFIYEFRNLYGLAPPNIEPLGHFLMDIEKQEDRESAEPLDLFNNAFETESDNFMGIKGCCQCTPYSMPLSINNNTARSGFPDDKHSDVFLRITAVSDVNICIAVELLNGQYTHEFDSYFATTTDRFSYSLSNTTRFSGSGSLEWINLIAKNTIIENNLDLPYNIPWNTLPNGQISLENLVLIDRPSLLLSRSSTTDNAERRSNFDDDGRLLLENIELPSLRDTLPLDVREAASWWDDGDKTLFEGIGFRRFTYLGLPYFPFISNCDAFDSHINLNTLLNDHPQCELIPIHETIPVRQNPSYRQYLPVGDRCIGKHNEGADLRCRYEENVDQISEKIRWYESDAGKTLFFISRDPLPVEYFAAKLKGTKVVEPWGRSLKLGSMVNTSFLVPIIVDSVHFGKRNTIPRSIILELTYFQRTQKDKRLVEGTLHFKDLCSTLKPVRYGGNAGFSVDMIKQGIEPCDLDIQGRIKSLEYTFHVLMYPLDWFQLFNKFQFGISIYFSIYSLVGLLILSICCCLWMLSRAITKLRYPPSFQGFHPTLEILRSTITGCLLAMAPLYVCLLISLSYLKDWHLSFPFRWLESIEKFVHHFPSDWYNRDLSSNGGSHTRGRLGLSLMVIGVYSSVTGIAAISSDRHKGHRGRLKADTRKPPNITEPKSTWMRAHIFLFSIIFQFALMGIWEFSYSSQFQSHALQFIFLLKLMELALDIVFAWSFDCPLQYAPMNVAVRITEMLVTLGAKDFINFIVLIFSQKVFSVIIKLYVHPPIKVLGRLWPRWEFLLTERLKWRQVTTNEEKKLKLDHLQQINTEIERKSDGVEPILELIEYMSVDWVAAALAPLMLLLLKVLYSETNIASNYNIRVNEVFYYELLATYMIPWSIAIDVVTLNSLQLLKGWKIFEYLSYLRYRFNARKDRWALDGRMYDHGISSKFWGMDQLGLSSQFYFIITYCSSGILLTMTSITILLRAEGYNILSDPSTGLLIGIVLAICKLVHFTFLKLSCVKIEKIGWRGLWAIKEHRGVMDDFVASKVTLGLRTGQTFDTSTENYVKLTGTNFREVFLEHNKPWIIQHLKDLITPDTLNHEPNVKEFFYNKFTEVLGVVKDSPRSDLSNNHAIISDDSDDNDPVHGRRGDWRGVHVKGQSLQLAQGWLRNARRRINLYNQVRGIIEYGKRKHCSVCNKTSPPCLSLNVFVGKDGKRDSRMLDDLIKNFEAENLGQTDDILLWKSYFRAKAELVTLCNLCVTSEASDIDRKVNKVNGKARTRPCDISSDEEDDGRSYETATVMLSSIEGSILHGWLGAARRELQRP